MGAAPTEVSTESLYRALSDDLRAFFGRRVGSSELADDLLQETFVRIHRHLGELNETARVLGWVYRVARSVLADHYRRDRPLDPLPDILADPADEANDLSPLVGAWLLGMIDSLPPTYRDALRLTEVEGLSQRQAAERLGLSHSGAKSRVQRGRAMLRERFDACCELEMDRAGRVVDIDPRADCC